MKRFLFGFLVALFLILNTIPYLHILADDMPTNSQYEMLGAYALSTLITSGEATELDFSDYTENDTSFLIDLGEAIFTGDWSGLAEDGLEWLGETADSIYDSYKEYVSQWKSDHLGIMYSNWFPDETIYVGPDDSYSLAVPLRKLLTPRGTSPTPTPDINYESYINLINGTNGEGYDFFWAYYSNFSGTFLIDDIPKSYSWAMLANINNRGIVGPDRQFDTAYILPYPIFNVNIYSFNNTYHVKLSNYSGESQGINMSGNYVYKCYANNIQMVAGSPETKFNQFYLDNYELYDGNLLDCFKYVENHFRNVNIYVDGVPWSIVSTDEPSYPIVIPGQLTIWNNQPLVYSFPTDTHIDLPDLTNIIRNAINGSGVVMWSDIADTYVDVNGQTAVAVTKIVRNDYDNLYMEQYPYPAMLIGMTDQTKFNEHLLDNSHTYLSPMGTVVQETVNVLPSEIVGVLAIGAILTIFAVIINRLLE